MQDLEADKSAFVLEGEVLLAALQRWIAANPNHDLVEAKLLEGIKRDLFTEKGPELFIKETFRLLAERRKTENTAGAQWKTRKAKVEKEIHNIVQVIRSGASQSPPKALLDELQTLEVERGTLEKRLETPEPAKKVLDMLPRAVERFKQLTERFEHVTLNHVPSVRPHLRTLLGEKVSLHPSADGYLEAELQGDCLGLYKLAAGSGKVELVAGKGFEPLTFGL